MANDNRRKYLKTDESVMIYHLSVKIRKISGEMLRSNGRLGLLKFSTELI